MVPPGVAEVAAKAQRELAGRVLAITLRSVRDLDIAEEATADAFLLALQTWPERGVPASVEAWLVTAARRRAIDRIRSAQAARRALIRTAGGLRSAGDAADLSTEVGVIGDEDLRLVVLCCDPRISESDQIALTLRLACGVPTAAIAAAFLIPDPSMAARLTRAKKKLAAAGPALDLPDDATVDARLPAVRRVVYLAFTLGHTAGAGAALVDDDLADRAQYLARTLSVLRPADPEFRGLLALILLTRARAGGRFDDNGAQVLLGDADRGRWDRAKINDGLTVLAGAADGTRGAGGTRGTDGPGGTAGTRGTAGPGGTAGTRGTDGPGGTAGARGTAGAMGITDPGPMVLQAAIAAEHAIAPTVERTNWRRIVELYGLLLQVEPTPTIALGRCVAMSQLLGPEQGLADLDEVIRLGGLERYPYAFGARAQMLDKLGRHEDAAHDWASAAQLARTAAERDFFGRQVARSDGAVHDPGR